MQYTVETIKQRLFRTISHFPAASKQKRDSNFRQRTVMNKTHNSSAEITKTRILGSLYLYLNTSAIIFFIEAESPLTKPTNLRNQDICWHTGHQNLQFLSHAPDFNMSFTCRKVGNITVLVEAQLIHITQQHTWVKAFLNKGKKHFTKFLI